MRILLSAYACEPNRGSEPGVGWGWATELAKHHEVWVITRDNNAPVIRKYLEEHSEYQMDTLHFEYVGVSKAISFWKKGNRGIRLYYWMWQQNAYHVAQKLCSRISFDLVQHVTFVSYTQPTYMYKLGIPFVWGPVSGGENIPETIKVPQTKIEVIKEFVRKKSQSVALLNKSTIQALEKSVAILVATNETREKIPNRYQNKTFLLPAIGLETLPELERHENKDGQINIVMAGRLISWKAFDIGIKAFLKVAKKYENVNLHILGEGEKKPELKRICGEMLNTRVFFDPPVRHDDIYAFYSKYDLFVNTTLRDSGCMAMMEALGVKTPCIAVATGGPKVLLENIPSGRLEPGTYDGMIDELAVLIEKFVVDHSYRNQLTKECEYARNNLTYYARYKEFREILNKVGVK